MKINILLALGATIMLSACSNRNNEYDASGVFEVTEVAVSAQASGELLEFDITEGQELLPQQQVGYIDTIQLHLKKTQLLAGMKAVESRHYNVSKQIAAIEQQIKTQKREQMRYENLVKLNAGNQKQLDDINAQISLLEKQLVAQKENLHNNNNSISGESLSLEAQIAQIEDQIQKSIIKSPIAGIVLSKYAEESELAMPGRVLFKVGDIKKMKLRVYITADQITSLQIGQVVKVYADQGMKDRKEYSGSVIWISDKAEFTPKTIQTRDERSNLVYAVKVAVENDGYIKKGMYGEIKIN